MSPPQVRVTVLQHEATEGLGRLATALQALSIQPEVVRIDRGQRVPADLGHSPAGLVVLGGPMSVNDSAPHLRDERRLIRFALENDLPVLGICLGSQLLAAELGAKVTVAARKEIGWFEVKRTEAGARDRLLGVAPATFPALHWHGEVFELPPGALSLASSALTEHQAFSFGKNAWGLLFHLEADQSQVAHMARAFADELAVESVATADLLDAGAQHVTHLSAVAAGVFDRFAMHVARSRRLSPPPTEFGAP